MTSSSSPSARLPSPPPMAEDQIHDNQPQGGKAESKLSPSERRIHPGTKASDITEPPLIELSEIDSPFALAEHLKALQFSYTHPPDSLHESPITKEQASSLAHAPPGVDRQIWLYELSRFLVQKINLVIVALFSDNPPCSAQTCSEMRASEWQYLCAVHNPPKGCCAIDYCCHTLDWAANSLTSPKEFPSRLSLGTENTIPAAQVKTITNIMRRVYRIFAHAWFSHREMFWKVEGRSGLYVLFKTVCDVYNLIPEDNYTIPSEAESGEPEEAQRSSQTTSQAPASIMKRSDHRPLQEPDESSFAATTALAPSATARRHRQTPSKGALVDTVLEENEDDDGGESTAHESDGEHHYARKLNRSDTRIHVDATSPNSSHLPSSPPQTSPDSIQNQPFSSHQSGLGIQHVSSDTTSDEQGPSPEPQNLPIMSNSAKAFSPFTSVSFSPVSPKAATFEEMEKEMEVSAQNASNHANEAEGEVAGKTTAVEGDDATKTVDD